MGMEANCTIRFGSRLSTGKAILETEDIVFRGDFRFAIPLRAVTSVRSDGDCLEVVYSDGVAVFELGPEAVKWEEKIRNPKPLIDKLGVKPGQRIHVDKVADRGFMEELHKRAIQVAEKECDHVFVQCEDKRRLKKLVSLRKRIKPDGSIWVIYPKGQNGIRQQDVFDAARAAGLVDIKIAAFSATHTALKLVIPKAKRKV